MTTVIGLPRRAFWLGTLVALAGGAAYTLSPTTVLFLLAMPMLLAWACRDTGPSERRWLLGLLGLAVALRLAALAVLFLSADHAREPFAVLFPDEPRLTARSMWLLRLALGLPLAPDDHAAVFYAYGQSSVQTVFAWWQFWVGYAPYGIHLLNVTMWLVGAIALFRTARRSFGPLPAMGGLAIVLFTPSLFAWSISALKEPAYFLVMATTIAGAVAAVHGSGARARALGAILVVIASVASRDLRSIAFFVSVGGLVVAAIGWLVTRRAWICVVTILLVAAGGSWAARQPAVQARLETAILGAAVSHLGHVWTSGHAYKLLDDQYYATGLGSYPTSPLEPGEAARFVVRAAASFVAVPLPWRAASVPAVAMIPQQVLWYVLGLLALVGVVVAWRLDAVLTWVLLGNVLVGVAAVSLYSGNVGTLVRLRDTVVPVLAWLSSLGGCAVVEHLGRRFSKGSRNDTNR